MESDGDVVLVTADARVRDAVESTAAALALRVVTVSTAEAALPRWAGARVVLVGGDQASAVASVAPAQRSGVHLVGFEAAELATWSMPLAAEVIPLPRGVAWLAGVLAADEPDSRCVAVLGGSGGVGASTLAAGLALAAARRGQGCALVDLDPIGGGIDLLLGAERTPGWRWPRLLGARGEVGDVRGVLPVVSGVTVVAMARGTSEAALTPESVHAVLGSLARHHALVVVDGGRTPVPAARQALRRADATVLAVGQGVRAVAAAARVGAGLEPGGVGLAVRVGAGGPPGGVVADVLGLPLWGEVPVDRHLGADADSGEPPGRPRSRWSRAVDRLLDRVTEEAGHGD